MVVGEVISFFKLGVFPFSGMQTTTSAVFREVFLFFHFLFVFSGLE